MIRLVSENDNFHILAKLLNDSFITVAKEFNLTKNNCASNNAFITEIELKRQMISRREFYYFEASKKPIGLISIVRALNENDLFYIENVAIHPKYRHNGYGKQLMKFAETRIKELGGKNISIGLINENTQLKDWYKLAGYIETGTKKFPHLPFVVCFMGKKI